MFLRALPRGGGRSPHPLRPTLVAGLLLGLLLAACAPAANGVRQETGPAIIRAAGRALGGARSFAIEATSTASGTPGSFSFEVEGPNQGGGTFTTPTLSFQAEELNGVDYFRSKTLWNGVGGATLQAALGDRWVYIAASSSTAVQLTQAFAGLTSARALAALLTKGAATAVRGKASSWAGQTVVAVSESKAGTVFVATAGPPYPLRWLQSPTDRLVFRDYGRKFNLRVPRKALNLAAILAG